MEERTIFQPSAIGSVRPGTRLNGVYEIEAPIAQGGMGEIYRGFNIQTHDLVAIKMILPEFSDNPEVMELFRREASILHNLGHEAIVRYFVFSVDPEIRRAYLAMEFVDGPSLTKRLASGPLPLAEVRILQRRIAHALEAAHRLGIVHRDVSPDNVILPDGDVRKAKIIDFGIARSLNMGDRTIIGGGFAGKYNYVSPEQLGLMGGDVTFKSDIYSLGLVLAEAARGRPLDMTGSQAQIIEKRRAVPDLSDLDRSIRPLIQAMLQPSPEKRPISMAAVAEYGESAQAAAARRARMREEEALESSGGHLAAILAAIIALVSLVGAGYFFRDDLARWMRPAGAPPATEAKAPPAPAPSPPAKTAQSPSNPESATPLPPLGPPGTIQPPTTPAAPIDEQIAKAPPSETPSTPAESAPGAPPPTQAPHRVPSSDELADAAGPRAQQPLVELSPAVVGTPYRADLPGFADPGGKGLRLAAESVPDGLSFTDLGGGRSAIEGTPTRAGSASAHVVATDHNGRKAEMTANMVVAERTPPPSSSKTAAPAQSDGAAPAPDSAAPQPLPVTPTQPEQSAPQPQKEARLESAADRARVFAASYNGGDCFLVKPLSGDGAAPAYLAIGDKLGPFQQFVEAFKREVGVEPQLMLRQITAPECPAVDLLRPGAGASGAPRIELTNYSVGPNKPLAGRIANLGGKRAVLLLIDNGGAAYRLDVKPEKGGEAVAFSVPLTPDADSAKQLQVLLAIASASPISALESFRSGPLKAIAPALVEQAKNGVASVGAEFFTFAQ